MPGGVVMPLREGNSGIVCSLCYALYASAHLQ